MTSRNLIAIGACALTLGLSVATLASAAPAGPQGGDTYRTAPPSSNPHDVFRTMVRVPRSGAASERASNCDGPMMAGASAATPKV
jgi:hypothetical protein